MLDITGWRMSKCLAREKIWIRDACSSSLFSKRIKILYILITEKLPVWLMSCPSAMLGHIDQCLRWVRCDLTSTMEASTWLSVHKVVSWRSSAVASSTPKRRAWALTSKGSKTWAIATWKKEEAWRILLAGWVRMITQISVWLLEVGFCKSTEASKKNPGNISLQGCKMNSTCNGGSCSSMWNRFRCNVACNNPSISRFASGPYYGTPIYV